MRGCADRTPLSGGGGFDTFGVGDLGSVVGALSHSYLGRVTRAQKAIRWWMPALYLGVAVLAFIDDDTRKGLLWLGFALYFAAYLGWVWYRARRSSRYVERLRAAGAEAPEAAADDFDVTGVSRERPRGR